MAQLIKRKSVWYIRFQYKGRDYWRSTGETSRAEAKTRAAEIEAEVIAHQEDEEIARPEAGASDRLARSARLPTGGHAF